MAEPEEWLLRNWMQTARYHLRKYASHPDFEDMVAEAYLGLWQGYQKYSHLGWDAARLRNYVLLQAYRRAIQWYRGPGSWFREQNSSGAPIACLSVPPRTARRLETPDFTAEILEKVEAEQISAWLREFYNKLPTRSQEILRQVIMEEIPISEVARKHRITSTRIHQIRAKFLKQARQRLWRDKRAVDYRSLLEAVLPKLGYGKQRI